MSRLRLENLVIYDGMGSTAQSRQTLLVEDGRIAYVGPQPPAAESGEKVVDGGWQDGVARAVQLPRAYVFVRAAAAGSQHDQGDSGSATDARGGHHHYPRRWR